MFKYKCNRIFLFVIFALLFVYCDSEVEGPEAAENGESFYNDAMAILNKTKPGQKTPKAVYGLLLAAAKLHHPKAREKLALDAFLNANSQNAIKAAASEFQSLTNEGNARGLFGLSLIYGNGLAEYETNTPKSLTYLYTSALSNDSLAEMAMGYRYWAGIGVESDCSTALTFYSRVATRVVSELSKKALVGSGMMVTDIGVHRIRLIDEAETGVMGGSSSAGSVYIDNDVLQYFHYMADKNNVSAQVGLGQLYYQGRHGVEEDHQTALYYFTKAASAGDSLAMAFLGEMYISGSESIEVNTALGLEYLEKSVKKNNPMAQTGMGLAYLHGKAGLIPDPVKALEYFLKAADQGWADAQLQIGIMFLGFESMANEKKGNMGTPIDHRLALKYLHLASQQSNVLAFYHLAQMHASGTSIPKSCKTATELYKNVAERGVWSHIFTTAHAAFWKEKFDEAFMQYLFLAEIGYEVAQSNVAYLLDEGKVKIVPKHEYFKRALVMWQRSANQGSLVSRLKLGDYHYYGLGTKVDYAAAIQHYRTASDIQRSAQAMFNLGYMHEQGLGYKRDMHLAKRYYDMASSSSTDAYVPVSLALLRLSFYFQWETIKESKYLGIIPRYFLGLKYQEKPTVPEPVVKAEANTEEDEEDNVFLDLLNDKLIKAVSFLDAMDWTDLDYFLIPFVGGLMLSLIVYIRRFN